MDIKTYRYSKFRAFALPIILVLYCGYYVVRMLIVIEGRHDEYYLLVVMLGLPPVLSVIFLCNLCYKVEISDEDVRIYRFGRATVALPFDEYFVGYRNEYAPLFGVNIGVDINAKRYLDTVGFDGRNKTYNCFSFSSKTMESMCEHLRSVENNKVDNFRYLKKSPILFNEGKYELPMEGVQLHFPKRECQNTVSRRFSKHSIWVGVVTLLLYGGFFTYIVNSENSVPLGVAKYYPWVLAPAVVAICAVIVLGIYYFKQSTKIPEEFRFSNDAMAIDDYIFYKNEIASISATASIVLQKPFRVRRISRRLTITTLRGKYNYYLGHINTKKGRFFYEDYSILIDSISAFMPQEKQAQAPTDD